MNNSYVDRNKFVQNIHNGVKAIRGKILIILSLLR